MAKVATKTGTKAFTEIEEKAPFPLPELALEVFEAGVLVVEGPAEELLWLLDDEEAELEEAAEVAEDAAPRVVAGASLDPAAAAGLLISRAATVGMMVSTLAA